MKEFSFSVPQEIIVGKGSLARLSEAAEKLGGKHGFIISGPHLNKMGIAASPWKMPVLRWMLIQKQKEIRRLKR